MENLDGKRRSITVQFAEGLEPRLTALDGAAALAQPTLIFFAVIGFILLVPVLLVGYTVVRVVLGSFFRALLPAGKRNPGINRLKREAAARN